MTSMIPLEHFRGHQYIEKCARSFQSLASFGQRVPHKARAVRTGPLSAGTSALAVGELFPPDPPVTASTDTASCYRFCKRHYIPPRCTWRSCTRRRQRTPRALPSRQRKMLQASSHLRLARQPPSMFIHVHFSPHE